MARARMLVRRGGTAAACALLALAGLAADPQEATAQGDARSQMTPALRRELDTMLSRQDALERENTRLRQQVAALEGRVGEAGGSADVAAPARNDSAPTGLNRGGGGVFVAGQDYSLTLFGYAQALGSVFDSRMKRADGNGEFTVRSARLDFYFDYLKKYQLLIELDAAPHNSVPGQSDFGLVVGSLNTKLMGDALQLEVGKIINPFSTENYRTSRDVDTIERYQALNSMFLLAALDAQYGAVLKGETGGDQSLGWYIGAFNGNGNAFDNLGDNNGGKELTGKLTWRTRGFSAGLGVDYSRERAQTLSLTDLGFNNFVSAPVDGKRIGVGADAFFEHGPFSLRTEGLAFRFDLGRSPASDDGDLLPLRGDAASLIGGFIQPAVYLWGDRSQGLQLLLRGEVSRLGLRGDLGLRGNPDGDTLYGLTLGANWYVNPNVRVQVNGVLHRFNGPSQLLGFRDAKTIPLLLTEIQVKF